MAMSEMLEGGMGLGKGAFTQIGFGVAGITAAMKAINTVETGQMGVRTRFKRVVFDKQGNPKMAKPGKHFTFPGVQSVNVISTQDHSQDLGRKRIDRQIDNRQQQIEVVSSVVWRVIAEGNNPYKAIYEVDSLPEAVTNKCSSGLYATVRGLNESDIYNEEAVMDGVMTWCEQPLLEYGVALRSVNIHEISRSIGQMLCEAASGSNTPDKLPNVLAVLASSGDTEDSTPNLTIVQ